MERWRTWKIENITLNKEKTIDKKVKSKHLLRWRWLRVPHRQILAAEIINNKQDPKVNDDARGEEGEQGGED